MEQPKNNLGNVVSFLKWYCAFSFISAPILTVALINPKAFCCQDTFLAYEILYIAGIVLPILVGYKFYSLVLVPMLKSSEDIYKLIVIHAGFYIYLTAASFIVNNLLLHSLNLPGISFNFSEFAFLIVIIIPMISSFLIAVLIGLFGSNLASLLYQNDFFVTIFWAKIDSVNHILPPATNLISIFIALFPILTLCYFLKKKK